MEQLRKYSHMKGYVYFFEALEIISANELMLYELMKVYKVIGDKHNASTDSVRLAISRFIKKFDERNPREFIAYYYYFYKVI